MTKIGVGAVATDYAPIEVRFSEALIDRQQALGFFSELASCPLDVLSLVFDWLQEADLTLSAADNQASLTKKLGNKDNDRLSARIVLAYFRLESLRRALDWTPDAFVEYFCHEYGEDAKEGQLPALDAPKHDAVAKLFSPSPRVDLIYKARRIYDGALPAFVSSATTVDFRPVFSDELDVRHGLITTMLELTVRKPDETAEMQRIVVQIDLKDISELEKTLSRARTKISKVREFTAAQNGIGLLNPKCSLEPES